MKSKETRYTYTCIHYTPNVSYIENSKDAIRKLLELISEFSKVTGHKINTQKSLAFLFTNNEKLEIEIKDSISSTIARK